MLSQAPARCANISDALDVPITDPSPRTNNAPSTINTRQLPQYAGLRRRCPTRPFQKLEKPSKKTRPRMLRATNWFFLPFANLNRYRNICEIAFALIFVSLSFSAIIIIVEQVKYDKAESFITAIIIRCSSFFRRCLKPWRIDDIKLIVCNLYATRYKYKMREFEAQRNVCRVII